MESGGDGRGTGASNGDAVTRGDLELIPLSALVQHAYCRRLGYLKYVDGESHDNEFIVDGRYKHRNVDRPAGMTRVADSAGAAKGHKKGNNDGYELHARTLTLSDGRLGLIGKLDLLEADGRTATPVEYKRGKVPDTPEHTYLDHRVHVCGQALLLRANGYECDRGIVYYIGSKKRIEVKIDKELEDETLRIADDLRRIAESPDAPPPLVDSPKCPGCSMVGICLPDEVNLLAGHDERHVTKDQVRRMYPLRNDAVPLYVQEQWATVGKSGDCLVVRRKGGDPEHFKLIDV